MQRSEYRPGRRRKPIVSALLDWAAGVLIGLLLVVLGAGVVALTVAPGLDRLGAMTVMISIVWPLGAVLGVWLSVGRPLTGRGLGYGLGLTLVGFALVLAPFWLDIDSLRGVAGVCALLLAPVCARVGVGLARRHEA